MPKISSAPEDAFHFKGSFADGWGVVTDAKAVVFQFPPTKEASGNRPAGSQDPPGLYAQLTIQRYIDGDGQKAATQSEEVLLGIQRASRDTGMLDAAHPGDYPDGNLDADPIDKTGELGAEGNTLYAVQDGFQLNDKTKWMSFTASLVERGFKPAVLKRTYFTDLVGLYAFFKTETRKKFRDDMTSDPTVFVVTEIKTFPYEKGAAKPAAKGKAKATATASGKPNGAPAPATTTAPAADASDLDAEQIATAILTDTLAPAKKGALLANDTKLKVEAFMCINKHKPAVPVELKKAVQEQLGDVSWLTATGEALGLLEVTDEGKIQFAS